MLNKEGEGTTTDIQEMSVRAAQAVESGRITGIEKKPKRVRYWPLYYWRYSTLMKVMHRLGWCYMHPNEALRDEHDRALHWCQWCGMRGFK